MATTFTRNTDGSITISETVEENTTLFDLETRLTVLQQRLQMIDQQIERQFGAQKMAVLAQIDATNTKIALVQAL